MLQQVFDDVWIHVFVFWISFFFYIFFFVLFYLDNIGRVHWMFRKMTGRDVIFSPICICNVESMSFNHITLAELLKGSASYGAGHLTKCALRAFDKIVVLNLVSWNVVIEGCANNSTEEKAFPKKEKRKRRRSGRKTQCLIVGIRTEFSGSKEWQVASPKTEQFFFRNRDNHMIFFCFL